MNVQRGKLVSGGRLQVPVDIRRALGLADGDTVMMRVVDGELHIRPQRDVLARIRERLRPYGPKDGSLLSDELIADRRAAADVE